jgi:hypothetical protein
MTRLNVSKRINLYNILHIKLVTSNKQPMDYAVCVHHDQPIIQNHICNINGVTVKPLLTTTSEQQPPVNNDKPESPTQLK